MARQAVAVDSRKLPSPELAVGSIIEGRYRLRSLLGSGASAAVYEAEALEPALAMHGKRRVALKVLSKEKAQNPDTSAWFTHEAYLGMKLRSRSLVRVLDFGYVADERPYAVMELVQGVTLEELLSEAGALPPDLAVALVEDCARGLAYLHARGLVHRDIKPGNLIVTFRGGKARLKILDLGVTGVFDAKKAARLGAVDVGARGSYGTPTTIAPEQILGLPTGPAADVYALACVAYRMLLGRDAFRGATITDTVRAHLVASPPLPSSIDPSLSPAVDAVFRRALARDHAKRTQSPLELAEALAEAVLGAPAGYSSMPTDGLDAPLRSSLPI